MTKEQGTKNQPSADHPEDNKENEQACEKCGEYKAGWQRAQADYKNLVKEVENNRSELVKLSERQILEDFIPVYDNFKKAFAMEQGTMSKEQENWTAGIGFIKKQFGDILKNYNVEEIKTVGGKFDPELHEALSEEESDQEPGTILKEMDSGYIKDGKVIKAAKVIVSK